MSIWRDGKWFCDVGIWRYIPAGTYNPAVRIENDQIVHSLEPREVDQLVDALQEAHWIKPKIDERVREEDIKIIHRLLDIIENRE